MSSWISIKDKLPETGKTVLVRIQSKSYPKYKRTTCATHIGYHECTNEDDDWKDSEVDTEYDEEKDCYWIPECWYEVNVVDDNPNWILNDDYVVIHWMYLPEPPED